MLFVFSSPVGDAFNRSATAASSWAAAKDCCKSTGSYRCNATRLIVFQKTTLHRKTTHTRRPTGAQSNGNQFETATEKIRWDPLSRCRLTPMHKARRSIQLRKEGVFRRRPTIHYFTYHDRTSPFHFLFGMSRVWSGVDGVIIDRFWRFSFGTELRYMSYPIVFLPFVIAFRRCWILWACCGFFGSSFRKTLSCLETSSQDFEWNLIFFKEFFPTFW